MESPTRNRKMFYQIADLIEERPELHDQNTYLTPSPNIGDPTLVETVLVNGKEIACGTSQCIAGWAFVLEGGAQYLANTLSGGYEDEQSNIVDPAANILGLDTEDARQLFYTFRSNREWDWPSALRDIGDGLNVDDVLTNRSYFK